MWPFECRELSIFREVWTVVIPFLERNSKIGLREAVDQVPYCQYQPSVLSSTRKCRRRYTWKCTFMGNCQKFKWSVTLTLTLDRVKVTSTYTVHVGLTCWPNHVTVALCNTEIWPFECRQISILHEVWTLMIAFLDGNSKIGLRQAVVQVPDYHRQPSLLSSTQKRRRR